MTTVECRYQPGIFFPPGGVALTEELNLVVLSRTESFGIQVFSCPKLFVFMFVAVTTR